MPMNTYDRFARGHRIPVHVTRDHAEVTPADEKHQETAAMPDQKQQIPQQEHPSPGMETDWRDQALRLQAEMVNYRKRQDRRVEEATANEKGRLFYQLLPVLDNFDRLMAHKEDGQDATLWGGVELTHRELARFLAAEGVSQIIALGTPFDPAEHEAVATVRTNAKPGTIIEELKPGYHLGDKLLRPAQVVVAGE